MTASAISKRYASALVDVLTAPGAGIDARQALGQIKAFAEALAGSPELHSVLVSPAVPPGRKRAVVTKIAERLGMARAPRNFLCVLIDHRRVAALDDIIEMAEELSDARLGFARARISSAQPLAEAQRAAVVGQLERLSGTRLRPLFTVDEGLIGGVVARIGSTVYDGSVKARLENLGRRLAAER
jgi:F-type H+-transporting ATPase subunit delta